MSETRCPICGSDVGHEPHACDAATEASAHDSRASQRITAIPVALPSLVDEPVPTPRPSDARLRPSGRTTSIPAPPSSSSLLITGDDEGEAEIEERMSARYSLRPTGTSQAPPSTARRIRAQVRTHADRTALLTYGAWLVASPLVMLALREPAGHRLSWLWAVPVSVAVAALSLGATELARRRAVAREHKRAFRNAVDSFGAPRVDLENAPDGVTVVLRGRLETGGIDLVQNVGSTDSVGLSVEYEAFPPNVSLRVSVGTLLVAIDAPVVLRAGNVHTLATARREDGLYVQKRVLRDGAEVLVRGRLEERMVPLGEGAPPSANPFRLVLERPDPGPLEARRGELEILATSPPLVRADWPIFAAPRPNVAVAILLLHAGLAHGATSFALASLACRSAPFESREECRVVAHPSFLLPFQAEATRRFCGGKVACSERGACTPVGKQCVAAADSDCADSVGCLREGRCSASAGACVATEADCARSEMCAREGRCGVDAAAGSCRIRHDEDCRNSDACRVANRCIKIADQCAPSCRDTEACRTEGLCSYRETGSAVAVCSAGQDSDCTDSRACHVEGRCSAVEGACRALRSMDCAKTTACKERGLCSPSEGICRATRDEDCRASQVCDERGLCSARAGSCVATTWNDCALSDECIVRGACLLLEGRCVGAKEWLKRDQAAPRR